MADKFLNETGLAYYHDRAKTIFENKIEKVKVNGTEQTITNKEVDLSIPTAESNSNHNFIIDDNKTGNDHAILTLNSTGADRGVFVEVQKGDPTGTITRPISAELASIDYVDANGGKIDKIKVNGTEQTITNKEVDLPITVEEAIAGGDTATGNDKKIKIQSSSSGTIYAEHKVSEFNAVSINKNGSTISSEKGAYHSTNGINAIFRDYEANTDTLTSLGYNGITISHTSDPEGSDPNVITQFNLSVSRNTGAPNLIMTPNIKEAFRTQLGIASAFTYKGSVATEADLPATGNTVGDVYDVQESGMNFAWDGTKWDALGSYVDTSLYWAKSELGAITTAEIDALFA